MKTRTLGSILAGSLLGSVLALATGPVMADDSGYGGSGSGEWTSGASALDDARKLIEMESFGSAIWQLKQLIEESPNNADAHNLLAFSYRSLKRFDEAERHYERALRLDPNHAGAYAYQGVLFLETGRPDKARRNLDRIREICGRGCSEYRNLRDAIQQMAASSGAT
jgi:tetratricopeptide (TPR) repeat protein